MRDMLQLKSTVMDYDAFCCVARELEWIDVGVRHEEGKKLYKNYGLAEIILAIMNIWRSRTIC